jgi:hypothetical protein
MIGRFVRRNWKAAVLFLLIVAMLLFAPEEEMKFIYTEF